ncbi:regucalcin [Crucibulum laeve]|uniref:Regucalcin n=1 Tax=Crucibulum laeve TaxID=68775 RepID=A0A5C3M6J4_9AGAR|nr:regucalcin [Crucibulum laeve]
MAQTRDIIVQHPWLNVGCTLGEGPLYDPTTSTLHFVDISEQKVRDVFHVNVDTHEISVEQYDDPVSCLALRRDGNGLACAARQGFALLQHSSLKYLSKPILSKDVEYIRFNDGACDSKGRFFAGTIYSKEHGIPGKLYRFDPSDDSCEIVDEGPFTDSNGLGWSPDEKTFYFTDSLVNIIYAYDYQDGDLSNRRVFIDAIARGLPEQTFCDGLCVDEEGCIWSARWGGSRIIRFALDGTIDFQIVFPTALNVTACCFGGPNNDQLFVTTAHCGAIGGDATRQERFPDSGHLFLVDLSGKFRGSKRYEFGG